MYQYEISVTDEFIINTLKLDKDTLEKLTYHGDIIEKIEEKEGYSAYNLYHSALADIYLKTASEYKILEKYINIPAELKKYEFSDAILRWYILSKPKNYWEIFARTWFNKELIDSLLANKVIKSAVLSMLENEQNVEKICTCVIKIAKVSEEAAKKLVDVVKKKFDDRSNVETINYCLGYIAWNNKEVAKKIIEKLDLNNFKKKLDIEHDVKKISSLVFDIAQLSEEVAKKLINVVKKKFDDKHTLGFPLLADEDHTVADAYGAWGEKSMYGNKYMGIIRSSFLVDEKGKIAGAWYKVSPAKTVPEAMKALEG